MSLLNQYKVAVGNRSALAVAGLAAGLVATYAIVRFATRPRPPKTGKYPVESLPKDSYDAVIVGAGPSGSTAAYYMVQGGAKIALLDKEQFPRDKYVILL